MDISLNLTTFNLFIYLSIYQSVYLFLSNYLSRIGIGMEASITPLRHSGLSLVPTTDFFYPLVEDPYMQVIN